MPRSIPLEGCKRLQAAQSSGRKGRRGVAGRGAAECVSYLIVLKHPYRFTQQTRAARVLGKKLLDARAQNGVA